MINTDYEYTLDTVLNFATLYNSFQQCKLTKMWKDSVVEFDLNWDKWINEILVEMYNSPYFKPMFHTIINERGKERLICSLHIRDRVIQKALNQNFLLPVFTPRLIYDNGASLKNKGMDFCLNRLKCHIDRQFRKSGLNFYFLKMDIKSYFDSIPHDPLRYRIRQFTNDYRLLYIFDLIFKQYKYDSFIHNGDNADIGIGLGGEVPQTFGILCLDPLDHIAKEEFGFKGYIRYMDDIIVLHENKEYLENFLAFVQFYLYNNLCGMKLNMDKTYIVHANQGIKFLKMHYYISETGAIYLDPDKKGVRRAQRRLNSLDELMQAGVIKHSDIKQAFDSYMGHLKRADNKSKIEKLNRWYNETLFVDWLNSGSYDLDNMELDENSLYEIGNCVYHPLV